MGDDQAVHTLELGERVLHNLAEAVKYALPFKADLAKLETDKATAESRRDAAVREADEAIAQARQARVDEEGALAEFRARDTAEREGMAKVRDGLQKELETLRAEKAELTEYVAAGRKRFGG
jgi:hypothetical protein